MAEAVGIAAGVSSLLKALGTAGVYLKGCTSASREAQEIANQVRATEAILKSLKASLRTIHRSEAFNNVWADSTRLVIHNIKATIEDLNGKLGSQKGTARLSFWAKAKWPLTREDSLMLQQHMQAYMQMLSMVQNAFMQGTLQTAQKSAREIDDIFTEIGTFPTSISGASGPAWSVSSQSTLVPGDSVSQLGAEPQVPIPPGLFDIPNSAAHLQNKANIGYYAEHISIVDICIVPELNKCQIHYEDQFGMEQDDGHGFFGQAGQPAPCPMVGFINPETLGPGTVLVDIDQGQNIGLLLIFKPQGMEEHIIRWKLSVPSPDFDRQGGPTDPGFGPILCPVGQPPPGNYPPGNQPDFRIVHITDANEDVDHNSPQATRQASSDHIVLKFGSSDDRNTFILRLRDCVERVEHEITRRKREKAIKARSSRMRQSTSHYAQGP